ncbi:hypothetical protein GUJ93_ZPchr0007g3613 [Zizania palustris]|uniref:Uncharacterized protein n=1 Tax=Zizania palustris TaxID=103762 RepID=A0A8J5VN12_ZIZPA|nr:hypothetical protein GUJ93_ZPchr0007g3613 [Zizania palustris]
MRARARAGVLRRTPRRPRHGGHARQNAAMVFGGAARGRGRGFSDTCIYPART